MPGAMVQPSFSHPRDADNEKTVSPTQPLDTFLDNQHQSYFEELYRSEAACLCILRYLIFMFQADERLLPPVCRHIILHNLWTYAPVRAVELKAFCQIDPLYPLDQFVIR